MAKDRPPQPRAPRRSMPRPKPRRARQAAAPPGPPAVIVHSLEHARAALAAAAALGVPVALWSAPGAAAYAGAGWFKAVIEAAQAAVPGAAFEAVLDCAELPGPVLGAFRIGGGAVCFTGSARTAQKLADIAGQLGRRLLRRRPARALDLRHVPDPAAACGAWLAGKRPRSAR